MQTTTALSYDQAVSAAITFEGDAVDVIAFAPDGRLEFGLSGLLVRVREYEGDAGCSLELSTGRLVLDRGAFERAAWEDPGATVPLVLVVALADGREVVVSER